ncbi:MAG: hypothetical protein KJ737_25780 [Proteobacteria bacterium]|nr:hypothetical protein [Pseudomonadota bacterium]
MDAYLKDLHPNNQLLIKLMQKYTFGSIENLIVKNGIPCLQNNPRLLWKVHFGFDSHIKKEVINSNFKLKKSHVELIQTFNLFKNMEVCIRKIDFHDGLPKIGSIELSPEHFLKNMRYPPF